MQRKCTGSAEEVHRKCRGSAEEVHRKCTGSAQEVHRKCTGSSRTARVSVVFTQRDLNVYSCCVVVQYATGNYAKIYLWSLLT